MALLHEEAAVHVREARQGLRDYMHKHKDAQGNFDIPAGSPQFIEVQNRNAKLTELVARHKTLVEMHTLAEANDAALAAGQEGRSTTGPHSPDTGTEHYVIDPRKVDFGQMFVETRTFREFKGNRGPSDSLKGVEVRTIMSSINGFAPEVVRNRAPVAAAGVMKPLGLLDFIPVYEVSQPGLKYMEEVYAEAALEKEETTHLVVDVYSEADLKFIERDSPARTVGVFIPITKEQMYDAVFLRQYLNDRLGLMIRQRIEYQAINGTGVNPLLKGMLAYDTKQTLNLSALVALEDDATILDAILEAITLGETGPFMTPDVLIGHPRVINKIRRIKNAQGDYLLGKPDEKGPLNIWGLTAVKSMSLAQTKLIVKATQALHFCPYKDLEVEVTNSHGGYFKEGVLAVRADVRCLFHDTRPESTIVVDLAA